MEDKGFVHVYTGDGKGKTTAAFGLALRAASAGERVYIGQFVKDMVYNECHLADLMPANVVIEQLGRGCFIQRNPERVDIDLAHEGLNRCLDMMQSGAFDMVILDEVTIAIYYKLLNEDEVIDAITRRNKGVEIVVTGRYAPEKLMEISDLVTEMKEVKHYYQQGILSRNGIDH